MKVVITGATGFIGTHLLESFPPGQHSVIVLGRKNPGLDSRIHFGAWDAEAAEPGPELLQSSDSVIHLAGAPLAQRWTPEAKRHILDSRALGTRNLVSAIGECLHRPRVLISASAIGIYGDRGDALLAESSPAGTGFPAEVCQLWEAEADRALEYGVRVVKIRFGMVLGAGGGALARMAPIFRWGVGGRLGDGRQWMSWIHIDDLIRMIHHALNDAGAAGVWNGVAPSPVTNQEFTRDLAAALHRPAVLPVPRFAIQMLYGEMTKILFDSQRVRPEAPLRANFRFDHPELPGALQAIFP